MPYLTLRKLYPDVNDNFVMAQARPGLMDEAVEEIRELLRRRRKVAFGAPDNFGISTSDQIITQFQAITGGVFALMVAILERRPSDWRHRRHEHHAGQRD